MPNRLPLSRFELKSLDIKAKTISCQSLFIVCYFCFRKRPNVTKGIEKTIGLFARKDSRKDSASTISYGAGVKDLKAKSVAAALERVSLTI